MALHQHKPFLETKLPNDEAPWRKQRKPKKISRLAPSLDHMRVQKKISDEE